MLAYGARENINMREYSKEKYSKIDKMSLCRKTQEKIQHLFLECEFVAQIWTPLYMVLSPNYNPPTTWNNVFVTWRQWYVGRFKHKYLFTHLWKKIPKFVWWEIWFARNKSIFQGYSSNPHQIFAKSCSLITKSFSLNFFSLAKPWSMNQSEIAWVSNILGSHMKRIHKPIYKNTK